MNRNIEKLKDYDTVVKALTNMSIEERKEWMNKATLATLYPERVAPMTKDEQLVIQHIFNASVLVFNKDGSKKADQPKDGVEAWLERELGSINKALLNQLV